MGRATSPLPPHVGGQRGDSRRGRGTYVRAGGPTCRWQRPTCNVHVSIRLRRHSPRRRVGDEMGCADRTPPSPCRCDSSHLVAPSHLPAAGCACLGGHSVRRSRGVSLVSSRLSRRDVREATLGTVTLLRSPLSEQAICGDSTRLTSRQCSKCASMRRARPAAAKTLSRAPVARLGCVVGVSETSFLRAMPLNAT